MVAVAGATAQRAVGAGVAGVALAGSAHAAAMIAAVRRTGGAAAVRAAVTMETLAGSAHTAALVTAVPRAEAGPGVWLDQTPGPWTPRERTHKKITHFKVIVSLLCTHCCV